MRKRDGLWAVCSNEKVVLNFDSYEQAIETARSAFGVLSKVRAEAERKLRATEPCSPDPCVPALGAPGPGVQQPCEP